MLCEVVNAVFLTYLGTEFLVASSSSGSSSPYSRQQHGTVALDWWKSRLNGALLSVVLIVNILDRLHVSGSFFLSFFSQFLGRLYHAPRILFAALGYMMALFLDCQRHIGNLSLKKFMKRVGFHFLKVLPAYPILAVLISCVFLFLITTFEALGLQLEWLNGPIYYGTLYGPFSVVYWNVKKSFMDDKNTLPTTTGYSACAADNTTVTNQNDMVAPESSGNPRLAAALRRSRGSKTHNNMI